MASKFYAVKKGKIPGIYNSWDDCKKMVDGFPGAVYKSFKTLEEAEAFVGAEDTSRKRSEKAEKPDTGKQEQNPAVYAFVDGSYNIATKVYGYGGFLIHNGEKEVLQGSGNDAEMASMRNVSGEILGAMAAVERAIELKLPQSFLLSHNQLTHPAAHYMQKRRIKRLLRCLQPIFPPSARLPPEGYHPQKPASHDT